MRKIIFILMSFLFFIPVMKGRDVRVVVADSTTGVPLPNASVYDRNGRAVGITDGKGSLPRIARDRYPITIRYIGFDERRVEADGCRDTVFLRENVSELPELTVESKKHRLLHILAYVREYSTLATYTDTVFLFREKTVDFMVPSDRKVRFMGWSAPRVLTSGSYFRFTNSDGLDSVSDASRHHFSWSDWVGLPPVRKLPPGLTAADVATDTVRGKYSPSEIWNRNGDRVAVDIDILADGANRGWVPDFAGFFRKEIDYDRFKVRYEFDGIVGDSVSPADMTGYTFHIESNGRGRNMFMFNSVDEPVFVTTDAEVYILDKEYITVKEAKKWTKTKFDVEEIGVLEPIDAPPLPSSVEALVARVGKIDQERLRLDFAPDQRYVSRFDGRKNFRIGNRALRLLKDVTGITYYKSHRNFNRKWNELKKWRDKDTKQ